MKLRRLPAAGLASLLFIYSGCGTIESGVAGKHALTPAAQSLKSGGNLKLSAKERAAYYLAAADKASQILRVDKDDKKALEVYNRAAAELTEILRTGDDGKLWNKTVTLSCPRGSYELQLAQGPGLWTPDRFTHFKPSYQIKQGRIRTKIRTEGLGGPLVGVYQTERVRAFGQRKPFEPRYGQVGPVTATIEFNGARALLSLNDPTKRKTARLAGRKYPLASDLSSVSAYYPMSNERWLGLMSMIHVEQYLSKAGLYMLEPYDPDQIPVIFVHGLMSTPQMWVNVINELEGDPEIGPKFQYWVFRYPTGNPAAYSAMLLRKELAKAQERYPLRNGFILVGHSMGGLLSRMQATNSDRALWDANFNKYADKYYKRLPKDNLIKQSLIFEANPDVKRIVFVCVPQRGSEMALGPIGALGRKLISLPNTLVVTIKNTAGDLLTSIDGKPSNLPTSITSLSPKNPTLLAMDKLPIQAPYHCIIGDRGKGNTPNSSDGIVPYWSSTLKGAQSELIVPGPHGSYELPQTIAEYKRILKLHLKSKGKRSPQPRI